MADAERQALRQALRAKIRSQRTSRTGPPDDPASMLRDPTGALMRLGIDDAAMLTRAPELVSVAKTLSSGGRLATRRHLEPGADSIAADTADDAAVVATADANDLNDLDDEAPPPEDGEAPPAEEDDEAPPPEL